MGGYPGNLLPPDGQTIQEKKAFHDWLKSQKASYIGIGFLQIYFVVSLFSKIEGLLCQYQVQNGIICRGRDVIFLS